MKPKGSQFTLYRGEGSHDTPSHYPPGDPRIGGYWSTDRRTAAHYAGPRGLVYKLEVNSLEAKDDLDPLLPGAHYVWDPKVRERRTLLEEPQKLPGME